MFRYTVVDAENAESLGVVAFAKPDRKRGDAIPQAPGRNLRVVQVWPAERGDQLPVLVVEVAKAQD
jgi:hypothetical protein